MYAWLKGTVIDVDGNDIVINTGQVGYRVQMGENCQHQLGIEINVEAEVVVYTAVREDEIKLYGFDSFLTRKVFVLLLGVNGVGPKAALNIVDQLDPAQVISAIRINDIAPFVAVSGIGKKTAQRIILDLQGKIDAFSQLTGGRSRGQTTLGQGDPIDTPSRLIADARSALSNLGFSEREVERVIHQHVGSGVKLDDIIRKCLADLRQ